MPITTSLRQAASRQRRRLGALLAAMVLLSGAAAARPTVEPADFVQAFGGAVIEVLPEPGRPDPLRAARLRDLLRAHVDLAGLGQRALGQPWRAADALERASFLALFEDMVVVTYGRRFADYGAARLEILGVWYEGRDAALVRSRLAPRWGRAIAIDWRLRGEGEGWKVVDLAIEGLSVTVLHRNDFAQLHRASGMAGLLDGLRARTTTADLAP